MVVTFFGAAYSVALAAFDFAFARFIAFRRGTWSRFASRRRVLERERRRSKAKEDLFPKSCVPTRARRLLADGCAPNDN